MTNAWRLDVEYITCMTLNFDSGPQCQQDEILTIQHLIE